MSARNGDINMTYIHKYLYILKLYSHFLYYNSIQIRNYAFYNYIRNDNMPCRLIQAHIANSSTGIYRNSTVLAIMMLNTNILHIGNLSHKVLRPI